MKNKVPFSQKKKIRKLICCQLEQDLKDLIQSKYPKDQESFQFQIRIIPLQTCQCQNATLISRSVSITEYNHQIFVGSALVEC